MTQHAAPATPNKLQLRAALLASIRQLSQNPMASKQEKAKHVAKLRQLNASVVIQTLLVQELSRQNPAEITQVIGELLMELGDLETVKDPLWQLIEDPQQPDGLKDWANVILRQLGDTEDPNRYLAYLDDPNALVSEETARMLALSAQNPESLIDFIDFIVSLTEADQTRLVQTLSEQYDEAYLVEILVPLLESDPGPATWPLVIDVLSQTRSEKAAWCLSQLQAWPEEKLPVPAKSIDAALAQLKLKGVVPVQPTPQAHPLQTQTEPYQAYSTLPDGMGNQGILVSRKKPNGDLTLACIALNDQYGVMDCFGFYEVSDAEFQKLSDKFHDGVTKIKVRFDDVAYKLAEAERMSRSQLFRLPYEFQCWRPLWESTLPKAQAPWETLPAEWYQPHWVEETDNLYQHPDFQTWFIEDGDEPSLAPVFASWRACLESLPETETLLSKADSLGQTLLEALWQTAWPGRLVSRLKESAYLLDQQQIHTFRDLAATAAEQVSQSQPAYAGFIKAFARRCLLETALRHRIGHKDYAALSQAVQAMVSRWDVV